MTTLTRLRDAAQAPWACDFYETFTPEVLLALLRVAEAAQKFRGQLGDHHHWRCQYNDGPHTGGPWDCTCGSHELRNSLAALEGGTHECEHPMKDTL